MPSIYDYLDYRCFLKDRIEELRKDGRFSFRNFNRRAGFRSSGALKLVMDGKRNLAQEGIYRVVKGLKMTVTESKFFAHLVSMNQASSHEEKDHHFRQLITYRPFREAKEMTALQYDCLSRWFYVAILEMVRLENFQDDPAWIASKLHPSITVSEARRALTDLLELKFLSRNGNGKIERTSATFSTPDEVASLSITNFHRQMCEVAREAVVNAPPEQREFSSVTISVSKRGFQEIKSRIQKFKRELDAVLEEDSLPRTQVAQMSLYLFPLTKEKL